MCGIAGIVSRQRQPAITRMTEILAHRGPDGEGFYRDERIALGHRRLSIIDIEGGHEPIANETGELQLVCNGEIYNSPALRRQLVDSGHVFRSATDVEVILHLYEDHGRDCVRYLRGMFAFALWDAARAELLLARDPLGQKPLFYYHDGEELVFASEAKGVLASGMVDPRLDVEALWHYVSLRFMPDRFTMFEGIEKLPAGSSLLYSRGRISIERYWQPDFTVKLRGDEREIEEALHDRLLETVKLHLLSDVRVGAFLSGGIDSTTIAAMMATVTAEPVPAFSIGVAEAEFNELPFARMVARRHGLEAHERIVAPDLIQLLPRMVHHMDEPADPFGFGVYLVSELAAETVKVALTGDGGDESFAGYDRYAGQRVVDYYCMLPGWLRRHLLGSIVRGIPESFGYKSLAQKARWVHELSFHTGADRYAESMGILRFPNAAKRRLFTERARRRLGEPDSSDKIRVHFQSGAAHDLVDRMLLTDLMTRIPDHNMVVDDRMAMAHSLESRAPFVDHELVGFAASIPSGMKLKGRRLKHILRGVAARYLPREVVTRQKQGFGFPLGRWMRGELEPVLRHVLRESRLVGTGMFEGAYVASLLDDHSKGRADHNYRLWLLLNVEIWHRLFVERQAVDLVAEQLDRLRADAR